jgi:uncharacterized protein (UPF0264 family)
VTALLASVRTEEEAVLAVGSGADIIDLKEPNAGALGALPLPLIETITARVRTLGAMPVSATIGDLDDGEIGEMLQRVEATAATGVDFVKVGIARGPRALQALRELADQPARVVPLFLADDGIDLDLVKAACVNGFPIVMVDTTDKRAGSLFDRVSLRTVQQMLAIVGDAGARCGLAGSLRFEHVILLRELRPAIAGFRGAICDGARTGKLVAEKVRSLRAALPVFDRGDLLAACAVGSLRP